MTHDRIKQARKVQRFNVAFFIKDGLGRHMRLDAALETTSYGTGCTFFVADAEGLYFTGVVPAEGWGKELYGLIRNQTQRVYTLDEQGKRAVCSGVFVIPEQKLSTGEAEQSDV